MLKIDLSEPNRNASITISRDIQTAYSICDERGPDPDWRYEDDAGHFHVWNMVSKEVTSLERVIDEVIEHPACKHNGCCYDYDCDDNETCEAWTEIKSHLECKLCGEPIAPGTKVIHRAGYPYYYSDDCLEITAEFEISGHEELKIANRASGRPELIEVIYGDKKFEGYINQIEYSDEARRAHFISFGKAN